MGSFTAKIAMKINAFIINSSDFMIFLMLNVIHI